jgi:tRNA-specific 2-thiouridylase
MNKKVLMAMSGGVDSSTAALLLKNKGYDVQGVFLDFFNDKSAARRVKKISAKIKISLKVVSVSKDFRKTIIKYFLEELGRGNTPNPCVVCNEKIKFRILFEKMPELKADFVATGHYARLQREFPISNFQFPNKSQFQNPKVHLLEAKDKKKDQSYFLYRLNQKKLSKIIFPLSNYSKAEVRKIAKEFSLPIHNKKESQDICFIPKKGYKNFLRKNFRLKKGKILDSKGNLLGTHEGLPVYTIGQRKDIKIGGKGPYYVIGKNLKQNNLIVGSEKELSSKKIKLKNINWIIGKPKFPFTALVRTRYRNPLIRATINKNGIKLEKPQRAITPGQFAVFYSKKGEVIGGGMIA